MSVILHVRRIVQSIYALAVAILLFLTVQLLAASVSFESVSAQMPPGLFCEAKKASWKLDIIVEPPKFKKGEIEYVFAGLKVIKETLTPEVKGQSVKLTIPKSTTDGGKIKFTGATIETSDLKVLAQYIVTVQVEAIYKAKGQPDEPVKSTELRLVVDGPAPTNAKIVKEGTKVESPGLNTNFKFEDGKRIGKVVVYVDGEVKQDVKDAKVLDKQIQLQFLSDKDDAGCFRWLQITRRYRSYKGDAILVRSKFGEIGPGIYYTRDGIGRYGANPIGAESYVDTSSLDERQFPFYDSAPGVLLIREGKALSVFDRPDLEPIAEVNTINLPKNYDKSKFVNVAEFDSYVVWHENTVIYHVNWKRETIFKDGTQMNVYTVPLGEATNKLGSFSPATTTKGKLYGLYDRTDPRNNGHDPPKGKEFVYPNPIR